MSSVHPAFIALLLLLGFSFAAAAQVPPIINHQGRVAVDGTNFDGSGQFKFALVNGNGSVTYWSNDGTSAAGSEPTAAVTLPVAKGLYSVLLGEAALTNMTAIPASVFRHSDVRLRVWFDDGVNGSQLLTPDQRIAPSGYAMRSQSSENVTSDGSINLEIDDDDDDTGSTLNILANGTNILTVKQTGALWTAGAFLDSDMDAGSNGQLLSSTGNGTDWVSLDSAGNFLRADGSVPLAGNLSVGNFRLTNIAFAVSNGQALIFGQGASGDLSGSLPGPQVAGLRGRAVSSAAPSNGEVLTWTGFFWEPQFVPVITDHGALSGLTDDDHPQYLRSNASDTYTAGTLTFAPASTVNINGTLNIGADSSTDNDSIAFDSASESLTWNDSLSRLEWSDDFYVLNSLEVDGTAQIDGLLDANAGAQISLSLVVQNDVTAGGYLKSSGPLLAGGSGATTAFNYFANSTPSPESADISNSGDLYVLNDIELDGELYVQSTIFFDNGAANGESVVWSTINDRFQFSDDLAAQSFAVTSDRHVKEALEAINPAEVLEKVRALAISSWQFKNDPRGIRHLGAMAQDFYAAFGLGPDDKHISIGDANGVALAAIQALYERSERRSRAIEKLKEANAALSARLEKLEEAIAQP